MKSLTWFVLAACTALAACGGKTTTVTNIKATTATLGYEGHCDANDAGRVFLEWQEPGATSWSSKFVPGDVMPDNFNDADPNTPGHQDDANTTADPCQQRIPGGTTEAPGSLGVAGLKPGTTYRYRVGFEYYNAGSPPPRPWADKDGAPNGTNYQTFTTELFSPGVVSSADEQKSCRAAQSLGAAHIRMEFPIATEPGTEMGDLIDYCADRNVRVLLLATFDGRTPTQAEAENLGDWADAYGPGGTFWASRGDGYLAVQQIEFGNETSYCYQYGWDVGSGACAGAWYNGSGYANLAKAYATRAIQAANAIAPKDVDLLVQADNGGVGSQWVDNMFTQEPNLDDSVGGWSVHPYGPEVRFEAKIDALISQTAARGASATVPIDATEYGMASDCPSEPPTCDSFPTNSGFPLDMTYAEAGAQLTTAVSTMKADYASRLRDLMIYQAHDVQAHNANNNPESFMGCLLIDETNKGGYSTACRGVLDD